MRKNIVAFIIFFLTAFTKVRLSSGDFEKEMFECGAIFEKYEHSQKQVIGKIEYGAYSDFLKMARKKFIIPGLYESFVPQGITFCEEKRSFMISGYSEGGGAAYIISVDNTSGRINGEYKIIKTDGSEFTGHSGGIASYGEYVYISDGNFLYYIPSDEFIRGKKTAVIKGEIRLPSAASYISTYGGYIWAGNFYHKTFAKNYDAAAVDKYNKLYRTVIVAYRFDAAYEGGIRTDTDGIEDTAVPFAAMCGPSEVQGVAFLKNGEVHISTSYGRNSVSMQRLYEYPLKRRCDSMIKIGTRDVPVWFLNNDSLKSAVSSFPMSEGVVCRDGKVYIVFESGAKKYRNTSTDPTDCVWEMKWK